MYKAKIEVVNNGEGILEITDVSESDEALGNREIFITDGHGETYYINMNVISVTELFEMPARDLAYKIVFKATPSGPVQEGSIYETTEYAISTYFADRYILKLLDSMHCNNGCGSNMREQSKVFEIINNIEGAKRYLAQCELYKAQRLLDYISGYHCNSVVNVNCCYCGKEY